MNLWKHTLATVGLMAGLGLAATADAQNQANRETFQDGGTIATASGTFTDANGVDPDELFIIDQSITLTASKWYDMSTRVVVTNGATLTIEPGTVFASDEEFGSDGSLIITAGSKINAVGTPEEPIIFTSLEDLANNWADLPSHPTGKDPDNRGVWTPGVQEWGSIAILGDARISDTRQNPGNPTAFDAEKVAPIEGLPTTGLDGIQLYGGLNDNDDSGAMRYVSIAYGGDNFDPATNAELNGMSWGGVGRGFDASHIEILNNVDDGLEIFGGAANVKNLLIWNIGDDSLDVDQGWRGQAQFVLVIQGAAGSFNQGSGFGDNGFEMDGADGDTTAQPVTAAAVWNATVIGAPEVTGDSPINDNDSTDHLVALRDNANVQIVNSIFMTPGASALVEDGKGATIPDPDNPDQDITIGGNDGDGSFGYGFDGTLTFEERWTTSSDWYQDPANGFPNQGGASAADFEAAYTAQDPGLNLLAIAGSVYYDISDFGDASTAATNFVVPASETVGAENTDLDNLIAANSPIVDITRADGPVGGFVIASSDSGDGVIGNVLSIDPRAANDAIAANRALKFVAPINGFYTQANYRGAVAPDIDWTQEWTALATKENPSNQKILASPANNAAAKAASGLGVQIAPAISFQSVDGVLYNVVAIDADGDETIVATVEGNGEVIDVADLLNAPIDASLRYEVRIAGL